MRCPLPDKLPGTQNFSHTPGLGERTPWRKRGVTVKDLADCADRAPGEMAQ